MNKSKQIQQEARWKFGIKALGHKGRDLACWSDRHSFTAKYCLCVSLPKFFEFLLSVKRLLSSVAFTAANRVLKHLYSAFQTPSIEEKIKKRRAEKSRGTSNRLTLRVQGFVARLLSTDVTEVQ